jgi:pyridoxamine 5'-phosphate oxidase
LVAEKLKTTIPYDTLPFNREDLFDDPVRQFALWYDQAAAQEAYDHTAMTLATVNQDYSVTARMLLLKEFSKEGFTFFTNYDSPKAKALEAVPHAALVFWWPACQRQVRITGKVSRISIERSEQYFRSRPLASQVAAIVSQQSKVIPNREVLIEAFDAASLQPVVIPQNWGGYNLVPETFEFWQGRAHRLHDRFEYRKNSHNQWDVFQLSP